MSELKVELTGQTRYFSVEDEEKDEAFTVIEFSDSEGSAILPSDWEVVEITGEKDKDVSGERRDELIEAVKSYLERR